MRARLQPSKRAHAAISLHLLVPIEASIVMPIEKMDFGRRSSNERIEAEKFEQRACAALFDADYDRSR